MNNVWNKIFEDIIRYEKEGVEMEQHLDKQIQAIIDKYAKQTTEDQIEKLRNHLSYIALIAEQEGFQLGVRFAIKLLLSLIKD